MGLEITRVQIRPCPFSTNDPLRAIATVILDNVFIVKDIRVINGPQGLFVAMPSRRGKDGTFRDVAHPLNSETRAYMEQTILNAYEAQQMAGPEGIIPFVTGLN